jgi:succinate dehydrogenase assembly factor 2
MMLCRFTLRANGFRNSNAIALSRQQARAYLGGAGDMKSRRDNADTDEVGKREQELWDRAQPRYEEIMARHLRLPTADNNDTNESTGMNEEERNLAVRKKRLVYRSKQRGWLEVDLLLGTWAAENVATLSVAELDDFENFVNLETIDIYNVLTLRTDVPEDMKTAGGDGLVERIQMWAKESPLGKADKDKYLEVKTKNNLI